MLTTVLRPNPTTPGDYHQALVHHIGHDLARRLHDRRGAVRVR